MVEFQEVVRIDPYRTSTMQINLKRHVFTDNTSRVQLFNSDSESEFLTIHNIVPNAMPAL